MRAFLEKIDREWLDDFVYISKYPLISQGYQIIAFNGEDAYEHLSRYSIHSDDICIGSVEATKLFFHEHGIPTPKSITYPEELMFFLDRSIIKTTLEHTGTDYPYFIKPADDVKLFTGDVVTSDKIKHAFIDYGFCHIDTSIYKSEYVDFISEYRIFVSNKHIYGIKHYKGDFKRFINIKVVDQMIEAYKYCPSAFTLDVGLTSDGRTLLVEANDMWAIGSYGLDGKSYTTLCIRRMAEILKHDPEL